MCGITAIFGNSKNKKEFLVKSLEKIKHRGTSYFEYEILENAGLGTNRLPITDPENGEQPFVKNNFYSVINGEIFNYKKLRKELKQKGYVFKTDCDTELLIPLYQEYGKEMIYKIDSDMFVFIIYDNTKNEFFVGRDRYGLKPLYYATDKDGNHYFASELKQLVQFDFIESIEIFPKSHIMENKKLIRYSNLKVSNRNKNEKYCINKLSKLVENSVKKRVNTKEPIAVLLSGGVDSSLIMEIATKYHNNVTAFILGTNDSSDYKAAIKLCKDKNYKYKVIKPKTNFKEKYKEMIYSIETYEAQIIRHSFASDILFDAIKKEGFKIAFTGEGADELFAGYNELLKISTEKINQSCFNLFNDLDRGHIQRIERLSMKHTIELRNPFFDKEIVNFAMNTSSELKIKNNQTKYILRKVAENYLPDYISWRDKMPLANGAGMNVGENYKIQDGEVAKKIVSNKRTNSKNDEILKYSFLTEEEKIYFEKFKKYNYTKLKNNHERIATKENIENKKKLTQNKFDSILNFLSNKKFSRCEPSNLDLIKNIKDNNLELIGFWGASNKKNITEKDIKTIKRINYIKSEIKQKFNIKVNFTFIFADKHAELNKFSKVNYIAYLKKIKQLLIQQNIKVIYLSSVWKKYNFSKKDILKSLNSPNNLLWENSKLKKSIEKTAQKMEFKNYKLEAKRYYLTRILEKNILEKEFKNSIFHTFANNDSAELYPNLPLLHFWSEKRGTSRVPWFE